MPSYNKAIVIGHVGQDPVYRKTAAGKAVVNFSVATSKKYKDQDGQMQEKTEWHNIIAWDKQAEMVTQYVKKGSCVMVEGALQTTSWEDKDGNKRYKTEIVAEPFGVHFMDTKKQQAESAAASISADEVPF